MSIQNKSRKILFLGLLFPMLALFGCPPPRQIQTQTKQKPGMYDLTGWNNAGVSSYTNKTFTGIDIEGKVGYRLEVGGPRAQCVSPSNKWTASIKIISGKLPPGMEFESLDIKGIPTKRGNYIVILELGAIRCNDFSYLSHTQELRFHIGGVGIVND
jgi:hypothetical protein